MGITYSDVSLCIEATGSHVPHKSLIRVHAAFKPDAAGAGLQDSAHADPGANTPSGVDIVHTLSARHRSVRFRSSLRISPDRIKSRLFCKRSPRLLFVAAACSGLDPVLARRHRGAHLELTRLCGSLHRRVRSTYRRAARTGAPGSVPRRRTSAARNAQHDPATELKADIKPRCARRSESTEVDKRRPRRGDRFRPAPGSARAAPTPLWLRQRRAPAAE